jgi:hypothetical protein
MANNDGTLIIAPVRPQSDQDAYPTAFAAELLGGHHEVLTLLDRNAIPAERREEGMTCWVVETDQMYVLSGGIDDLNWLEFSTQGASGALPAIGPFTVLANPTALIATPQAVPLSAPLLFAAGAMALGDLITDGGNF